MQEEHYTALRSVPIWSRHRIVRRLKSGETAINSSHKAHISRCITAVFISNKIPCDAINRLRWFSVLGVMHCSASDENR